MMRKSPLKCVYCDSAQHRSSQCYKVLTVTDRMEILEENSVVSSNISSHTQREIRLPGSTQQDPLAEETTSNTGTDPIQKGTGEEKAIGVKVRQ